MRTAIVQFPGLNRDRDMVDAITKIAGNAPELIWYTETEIAKEVDLVIIPGGFSYGDYLRAGAIAARAPIMDAIREKATQGAGVLGVCNGFQILTEAGLLPGALMRNAGLNFVCKMVELEVTNSDIRFTSQYNKGQVITCPVAHHDGNYFANETTLKTLEDQNRVIFRYANGTNPNGSINDIAGITNETGNVLGMMPHPENLIEEAHLNVDAKSFDGRALFESALGSITGTGAGA
jgi:phosphoribosylformylglycinamidine synthase